MATNSKQSSEKLFTIPIYDCYLRVIIAKDIYEARKARADLFGKPEHEDYDALCCRSGGNNFGLFFTPESARELDVIAHEVFHLTHRILEWASVKHDKDNHESGALLCGYLMKLVMDALKPSKKVKVRRKEIVYG